MSSRSRSSLPSSSPEPSGRDDASGSDPFRSKRRRVTRSKAGCLTCRKRRKLCDMARPVCHACDRLEMECVWPQNEPGEASRAVPPRKLSEVPQMQHHQSAPPLAPTPLYSLPQSMSAPSVLPSAPSSAPPFLPSATPTPAPKATVDDLMQIFGTGSNGHTNPVPPIAYAPPPSQQQTSFDPFRPMGNFTAVTPPGAGAGDFSSLFPDSFNFDESTLQLWAADCLPIASTAMTTNPFDSLFQVLARQNNPVDATFGAAVPSPVPPLTSKTSTPIGSEVTTPHHTSLMKHYRESLSALVAVPDKVVSSLDAFDTFTRLASLHASSLEGHGLQLSILAWAGIHMVNQGKPRYEAVAEKLAARSQQITMDKCRDARQAGQVNVTEGERLTLLGSILMLWSFKICRGDVWGFVEMRDHLAWLAGPLYDSTRGPYQSDSVQRCFLENILGVDILSSFSFIGPSVVPMEYIASCCENLGGIADRTDAMLLFITKRIGLIGQLVQRRRALSRAPASDSMANGFRSIGEGDSLAEIALKADELAEELKDEGRRAATLFKDPQRAKLYAVFRLTSLIAVHSFVCLEAPTSMKVRLLVNDTIDLLGQLASEKTSGWSFCLFGLFVTALCSLPSVSVPTPGETKPAVSQRERLEQLFDMQIDDLGHRNVAKAWKIVQEVWNRNQEGRVFVDWLDIVVDWDWELILA